MVAYRIRPVMNSSGTSSVVRGSLTPGKCCSRHNDTYANRGTPGHIVVAVAVRGGRLCPHDWALRSPCAFSLDGSGFRVAERCIIKFPEQSVTYVPTRCITNASMLHSQEVCQKANLQFDKPNTLPEAFNAWQFIIDVTGRRATFAIPYAGRNWKVCLLAAGVPGKESATLCIIAARSERKQNRGCR